MIYLLLLCITRQNKAEQGRTGQSNIDYDAFIVRIDNEIEQKRQAIARLNGKIEDWSEDGEEGDFVQGFKQKIVNLEAEIARLERSKQDYQSKV